VGSLAAEALPCADALVDVSEEDEDDEFDFEVESLF
jgi:hypothetical protein